MLPLPFGEVTATVSDAELLLRKPERRRDAAPLLPATPGEVAALALPEEFDGPVAARFLFGALRSFEVSLLENRSLADVLRRK